MSSQQEVASPVCNDNHAPPRGWLRSFWFRIRKRFAGSKPAAEPASRRPGAREFQPLEHVEVAEGVAETLFEEYARHQLSDRGNEEIGWLLLGTREVDHVKVCATLPAGTQRDAGKSHVRFDSVGQVIGSHFVRQHDRRITTVGVAHTHPGKLREPSKGDYKGDLPWVEQRIRGHEGVFAIGNVDAQKNSDLLTCDAPTNVQYCDGLSFRWFSLRAKASGYVPLEMRLKQGEDLAKSLRGAWAKIEEHGPALERLFRQQARVQAAVAELDETTLVLTLPLLEEDRAVKLLLEPHAVRYYVEEAGELFEVDGLSSRIDQATYLLLAELASRA